MKPIPFNAGHAPRVHAISDSIANATAWVRRAVTAKPRPAAYREHDPRKAETTHLSPVTPAHLTGAGGRAEFLRLPRL